MKRIIIYLLIFIFSAFSSVQAENYPNKKVLVLVEGDYVFNSKAYATANGRQLTQLLGHFQTTVTIGV